jgi:hypothetical protein
MGHRGGVIVAALGVLGLKLLENFYLQLVIFLIFWSAVRVQEAYLVRLMFRAIIPNRAAAVGVEALW